MAKKPTVYLTKRSGEAMKKRLFRLENRMVLLTGTVEKFRRELRSLQPKARR